jgi:hypothetical protein
MIIDSKSPMGNAYAIMAEVKKRVPVDDWQSISQKMRSGDYTYLCEVAKAVTDGEVEVI